MFEYALWAITMVSSAISTGRWPTNGPKPGSSSPARRRRLPIGIMGLSGGPISPINWLASAIGSPAGRAVKQLAGVTCYRGEEALDSFLGSLDGLINLLPLTAQTRSILAAPLFSRLPAGAVLITCGRREHMVNEDVLAALESGQLAGAVLDVFPQEPLPADDPLWRHPAGGHHPHMASAGSAEVIARQLLENIQRQRRGLPLKNLVNKHAGY